MLLSNNLFLVSVLVLLIVAILGVAVVLYFATRPVGEKPKPEVVPTWSADALRAGFRQAIDIIESNISSRAERYNVPWVVVLEDGDQARLPLGHTGIPGVYGSGPALSQQIHWEFFERGVVVDLAVGATQESDRDEQWEQFLTLCRSYRPQRPFDSVVVTIPAALLLDSEARPELIRRAGVMHRRLWLAQNRFAMRLALYVLVTECESMTGFSAFARALPDGMRASMLGWSSPYDPSISYQSDWVEQAMADVAATVDDTVAEVLVTREVGVADMLVLTSRVREIQPQLQLYLDELMRPNVYHEPFLLRGVYLTGDSGELQAPQSANAPDLLQPAFLRAVFERKIFLESGLTRPIRNATLTRPLLHKGLRFAAGGVLGIWAIGIVVATIDVGRHAPGQVAALREIRRIAAADDQDRSADWYQRSAITLLGLEPEVRGEGGLAWMLPGSWSMFDGLNAALREALMREFRDVVRVAIERGFAARATALSGQTGPDGPCRAPAGLAEGADVLALTDRADFRAMLAYVSQVERFSNAWSAWHDRTAGVLSLQPAVQYALGIDASPSALQILASMPPPEAHQNVYADAFRCAYEKGMGQLEDSLFTQNPLLRAERKAQHALAAFTQRAPVDGEADLRDLVHAISAEQDLLSSANTAWLHQDVFMPDPLLEQIFSTAAKVPLLGQTVVAKSRASFQDAFAVLRSQIASFTSGSDAGLQWRENQYVLSPGRLALRDSLAGLLVQPFMQVPPATQVPDLRGAALVHWDISALDQALVLMDARTAFLARGLAGVPLTYVPAVMQSANAQAGLGLYRRAVAALEPGFALRSMEFQAAADRVRRIASLLGDLGAVRERGELLALLSRGALAALTHLDDMLRRADLYAVQTDVSLPGTSLLAAFGVADLAGLDAYLAQQAGTLQELSAQAAVYLTALSPSDARSVVAQRWQMIGQELERYALRNPNSALLRLEQWIRLAGQTKDCAKWPAAPSASSGYFELHWSRLAATLRERCLGRDSLQFQTDWRRFTTAYNELLGGRMPVADPKAPSRGVVPRPAATVQGVQDVLGRFQSLPSYEWPPGAIADFLTRFRAWAEVLQPLWSATGESGYHLAWNFRVNRGAEVAANQIISWTLSVGSESVGSDMPDARLRWAVGLPITLSVRLAKDAPLLPRADPTQPRMSVDGHQVSWTFHGPWALFTMLGWQGLDSGLLRFEVPVMVENINDFARLPPGQKLKFFVDLNLFSLGEGKPLNWARPLPLIAPAGSGP
ncbi:hypothetical protein D0839_04600 [Bordetella avium]|uniref:type VI secretion system protein n=1 Tax=Bordetella avium TaxID=521 RepID=UPI000E6A01D7|nr:type VI secretion system protein [Bordetella avium]RIQ72115.1 hypothetical protein D0839_04600 [Bordetella avium]